MSEKKTPYKRQMVQVPHELFEYLAAEAEKEKRSIPNQVVLILEEHYQIRPTYKVLTDRK